jgi:dynein heavy chain
MCMKILEMQKKITSQEIRFLMVGGTYTSPSRSIPDKAKSWLSNKSWCNILEMSENLKIFEGFDKDFDKYVGDW